MTNRSVIVNPLQETVDAEQRRAENALSGQIEDIPGVNSESDADVRDMLVNEDLATDSGNNWNGDDREWVQSGLSSDQLNAVYSINSNSEAQNKIFRIYGVANVASDPLTTTIEFQDGTGAGFFEFNVQTYDLVELSDVILFKNHITYGVNEDGTIQQWANGSGADNVIYLAKVAEQHGNTLTPRN